MKALILAAGKGTRLRPVAGQRPKPLIPVGGTSPLRHAVDWVAALEPACIWINVHAGAAQIMEAIGREATGVPVLYSHEPVLLGTAGAWKKLAREWTEPALVVYGDNLMRFDLRRLLAAHEGAGALATIAVFDPSRHRNTGIGGGRVELDGTRVVRFTEGGAAGIVNAGAYVLEPALATRLADGFLDFGHDVFPALAAAGELAAHMVEDAGYCLGVDTPERLASARELMIAQEAAG
ncbi:MAG TPA: nucleotidyltransferase family protein [Longimicrobiales bacterium]|nr:nucleotidyltransferase family protein [Longimicrobiales bacterium]